MESKPTLWWYACEHCMRTYRDHSPREKTKCPDCGKNGITLREYDKVTATKRGKHETPFLIIGLLCTAGLVFMVGGCTYSFFTETWSSLAVGSLFFLIAVALINKDSWW